MPTLVVHNRDDQAIPFTAGQELAALVPGAMLHALDGNEHDPFIRDAGSVVEAILAFASGRAIAPGPPRPLGDPGLTGRERKVLRLVASTNEQIAATLAIAVKTVERHVTNAYRKVGAAGRADATRCAVALGRHALTPPARPAGNPSRAPAGSSRCAARPRLLHLAGMVRRWLRRTGAAAVGLAPLLAELEGYRFLLMNLTGGGSDGIDLWSVDQRRLARDTLDAVYEHFGLDAAPVVAASLAGPGRCGTASTVPGG